MATTGKTIQSGLSDPLNPLDDVKRASKPALKLMLALGPAQRVAEGIQRTGLAAGGGAADSREDVVRKQHVRREERSPVFGGKAAARFVTDGVGRLEIEDQL